MANYETISQREKIENKDIGEIIDYIERHFESIEWKGNLNWHYDFRFDINKDKISLFFHSSRCEIRNEIGFVIKCDTKLLNQEKVWILAYIKNTK